MTSLFCLGKETGLWPAVPSRRTPAGFALLTLLLALASAAVFSVACGGGDAPTPTPEAGPEANADPTASPQAAPVHEDDILTRAYVEAAIARYDRDGRQAAFAYYNSRDSLEGQRSLLVLDPATLTVWVSLTPPFAIVIGAGFRDSNEYGELTATLRAWDEATAAGEGWLEYQAVNPLTGQIEPTRSLGILHDGLIFASGHSILQQNISDTTKYYVNKARLHYEDNGLEATIAHYNSRDSLDGYLYLFLMDENDTYLAHPIREDLRGTDIKAVTGKDFEGNYYELGKDIAKATEEGIWVEYLWPNPVNGQDEAKTTWAIRHKGLIFASGNYKPLPEEERPSWLGADPRQYTVDYVNRAIKRYEEEGLGAMLSYYDSVASFEGEWYLFATDADDTYIVHPFKPNLKGTDIKSVTGRDLDGNDGFELGRALAEADEGDGIWVEYLWPHPATYRDAAKVGYAVRKDGMLFASGYYPVPADMPAFVQDFVQGAIDLYDRDGLDGVKAVYGQGGNSDGLWFLQVLDENAVYVVNGVNPWHTGSDATLLPHVDMDGNPFIPQALETTEAGRWINVPWPVINGPQNLIAHFWVVRHDGLFFLTPYYDTLSSIPANN